MSDHTPEPPPTKRTTSKNSQNAKKTINPSKYRVTKDISEKLDAAKMDGSNECELSDQEFDYISGNGFDSTGAKANHIYFDDVHVFREGKMDEVMASMDRTAEDLIADEEEQSRVKREAKLAKKGQLTRPEIRDEEYHPRKGPKGAA